MGGNQISKNGSVRNNNVTVSSRRNSRIKNRLSLINPEFDSSNSSDDINSSGKNKYKISLNEHDIDRHQQLHYAWRLVWETNYSSPVGHVLKNRNNVRILDVGCGSGVWLLEMAANYQNANFFGVDIVESFPTEIKPPNVRFQLVDLQNGLPYPEEYFDFVVIRNMQTEFTVPEWRETILPELQRVLKSGGFIESNEYIWKIDEMDAAFNLLFNAWKSNYKERDIEIHIAKLLPDWLETTTTCTFANTHQETRSHPLGTAGGEVAKSFQDIILNDFRTNKSRLLSQMNISSKRYDNAVMLVQQKFQSDCSCDGGQVTKQSLGYLYPKSIIRLKKSLCPLIRRKRTTTTGDNDTLNGTQNFKDNWSDGDEDNNE
ncbi:1960_t:CDS:2 [Ambispora gerdemannii]|uniref:1960_t:CDS:1 n=1 Tax=Ambispora gerdemannii TaxID=144530 RepID=A0A9N9F324_9GLOM|nr:1960_t:CDS:2 [Ambispora gerdemannii]